MPQLLSQFFHHLPSRIVIIRFVSAYIDVFYWNRFHASVIYFAVVEFPPLLLKYITNQCKYSEVVSHTAQI